MSASLSDLLVCFYYNKMTKQSIEERFEKYIDNQIEFLFDHWAMEDIKPYTFGGWREEVVTEIRVCVEKLISQELSTFAEEVEPILNRYEISSDGIDDNNDMLKGLIKEMRQALTSLKDQKK